MGKKEREGEGREQRWSSLNNLEDVLDPSAEPFMPRTCTRAHRAICYQYCCFCSMPRTAVCTNYLQEMCGRHGDGSATRLTTLLITTCQHRRVPDVFSFSG